MRWPPIFPIRRVVMRPPSRLLWHCTPSSASIVLCVCLRSRCPFLRLHRLLASRSRWAGYLQSLPVDQNWDGIALFWGGDTLSTHNASDGHRTELEGLDLDGDAVEAIRWLNGTEARKHLSLPSEPRTPILVPCSPPPATGTVEGDSMTNTSKPFLLSPCDRTKF